MLIEDTERAAHDLRDNAITRVGTRFSMVQDALLKDRPHLDDALRQYLDALFEAFADFGLSGPDREPIDDRVVDMIAKMKILRDQFLECADLAAKKERYAELHAVIRSRLGALLAYKLAPRDVVHFNHLWCDHYRFVLREMFIGVIALLVKNQRFDEVNNYLDAEYLFETERGPQTASFLKFDAYIKTLDEFRARRLGLKRLSIAADLQRERSDLKLQTFEDVMQADFLLCVRGLLHHPRALSRWFPRTLVYAEQFERDGFDLFFQAQSKKKFPAIAAVLQVKNRADLERRFAEASKSCSLSQWKIGEVPIPFEAYMALRSLETS
ncbi:MAG: hypothetical protein HKM98_05775 [Gammaproteobacteria bacterium]|nr:hypothetical protein [Gammaproteobacteria bacterium]